MFFARVLVHTHWDTTDKLLTVLAEDSSFEVRSAACLSLVHRNTAEANTTLRAILSSQNHPSNRVLNNTIAMDEARLKRSQVDK